jgi:hypothetical protein
MDIFASACSLGQDRDDPAKAGHPRLHSDSVMSSIPLKQSYRMSGKE